MDNQVLQPLLIKVYKKLTKMDMVALDKMALNNCLKSSFQSGVNRYNQIGAKPIPSDPYLK